MTKGTSGSAAPTGQGLQQSHGSRPRSAALQLVVDKIVRKRAGVKIETDQRGSVHGSVVVAFSSAVNAPR